MKYSAVAIFLISSFNSAQIKALKNYLPETILFGINQNRNRKKSAHHSYNHFLSINTIIINQSKI